MIPDQLLEKIREALRASGASQVIAVHEGYGAEWAVQEHEDPMLDALAPLIAAEVRKAQADAWDEGYEAGDEDGYLMGRDEPFDVSAPNPYRASETA